MKFIARKAAMLTSMNDGAMYPLCHGVVAWHGVGILVELMHHGIDARRISWNYLSLAKPHGRNAYFDELMARCILCVMASLRDTAFGFLSS